MFYKKKWKKKLYENHGYADNYTEDKFFLTDLKRNIDLKEATLKEAVLKTTVLMEEICNVTTFALLYFCLLNSCVKPNTILFSSSGITLLGFIYYLFISNKHIKEKIGNDLRTVLTFLVFGQLFSPVLYTLTDTVSTNTIYTMTFLMIIVHLTFFDYGSKVAIVSSSFSLSAAIFASICLASRLSSSYDAFILMTISTELFVLFPIFRHELKSVILVPLTLFLTNLLGLFYTSLPLAGLFLMLVFFINFACPYVFIKYQSFKDNIYGPWDEAIVNDVHSVYFSQ